MYASCMVYVFRAGKSCSKPLKHFFCPYTAVKVATAIAWALCCNTRADNGHDVKSNHFARVVLLL